MIRVWEGRTREGREVRIGRSPQRRESEKNGLNTSECFTNFLKSLLSAVAEQKSLSNVNNLTSMGKAESRYSQGVSGTEIATKNYYFYGYF